VDGRSTSGSTVRFNDEKLRVVLDLGPQDGETAVLSLLAVREREAWVAVAGSLLTVPAEVAEMSWPEWSGEQPATRARLPANDHDLGPTFDEEPFIGLRMIRALIGRKEWRARIEEVEAGSLTLVDDSFRFDAEGFSAIKLFAQDGDSDAHQVLDGAHRPVRGVAANLQVPELPHSEDFWVRGGSPKPMGQHTREELRGKETFHNWPARLLGIRWLGTSEFAPPGAFVIGKAQRDIWITDMLPDYENRQIEIVLAWDADLIDPLSCSILLRSERDGATLLNRLWKISDLPGEGAQSAVGKEPRDLAWNERTISVRLPRGPRRTEFGIMLLGADGGLRDERPVVPRIEQIEMSIGVMDAPEPFSTSLIGDPDEPPSEAERNQEATAARIVEEEVREVAARRRLTTTGDLQKYLRWRFSNRSGELLVLDRYLFDYKNTEGVGGVIDFLATFDRPVRALVSKGSDSAKELLAARPQIEARRTSAGYFHDRLWITGETAVMVGTSVNQFLKEGAVPATSAVDLPYADSMTWRAQFETWWLAAKPL
jgi:hypothetical protein